MTDEIIKEKEKEVHGNQIDLGDLKLISTTLSMDELTAQASKMLRDKDISKYLNITLPLKKTSGMF